LSRPLFSLSFSLSGSNLFFSLIIKTFSVQPTHIFKYCMFALWGNSDCVPRKLQREHLTVVGGGVSL
jgi:hypothetical protein